MPPRSLRALLGAVALVVLLAPAAAQAAPSRPVKVMTRNVYLGADIQRPIRATAGCTSQQACFFAFANANDTLWNIVQQTDFAARAELLANEIAEHEPDLIGLQEVALWKHGPLNNPAEAGIVDQDFLAILKAALAARGLGYETIHVQKEIDVEGPSVPGFNVAAGVDRRLTIHDVILGRSESVKVAAHDGGQYAVQAFANIAGQTVFFNRGFAWADVTVKKRSFRFVTTHLEAFSSAVANAQATQLINGAAAQGSRDVILVGDFNSDPLNHTGSPPHSTAYNTIKNAGFTDGWLATGTSNPGWTAGLSETVNDPTAAAIDHRIDLIWGRPATGGAAIPFNHPKIVGTQPGNRTAGGLWPSDHAGVVLKAYP